MPVARWRGRDCGRSMTSVSSSKREKTRAWASPTPAGQYLAKNSQGLHQRRTRPPYRSCSSQRQGSPLWTFCEEISADRDRSEANRQPGSCVTRWMPPYHSSSARCQPQQLHRTERPIRVRILFSHCGHDVMRPLVCAFATVTVCGSPKSASRF